MLCSTIQQRRHVNGRCPNVSGQQIRGNDMALKRMDNVGIVVESLDTAISFFELSLTLEGRAMIEGEWAGRVTG
ncbi:MAG: hypothetical protein ACRD4B_08095, partial [Acidobacteriota bacterium]